MKHRKFEQFILHFYNHYQELVLQAPKVCVE